jgi:hypothetical protein
VLGTCFIHHPWSCPILESLPVQEPVIAPTCVAQVLLYFANAIRGAYGGLLQDEARGMGQRLAAMRRATPNPAIAARAPLTTNPAY